MADSTARRCAFCGADNDEDAVFCGSCGRAMAGPTLTPRPPARPPAHSGSESRTMLGLPAAAVLEEARKVAGAVDGPGSSPTLLDGLALPPDVLSLLGGPPAPAERSRDPRDNVLGGPTMFDSGPPAFDGEEVEPPAPERQEPTSPHGSMAALERGAVPGSGRTPEGEPPAEGGTDGPTAAPRPHRPVGGMTMLGLPEPPKPGEVPGSPKSRRDPAARSPARPVHALGGMTMLGLPRQPPRASSDEPLQRGAGGASPIGLPPQDAGMTMLGVPPPQAASVPESAGSPARAAGGERLSAVEGPDELSARPGRRRRGLGVVVVVLVLLIVGVGGATAALLFRESPPTVSPEVAAAGDVLRVTLVVDPSPEGGRVRFEGQERPLVGGRASFEVPATTVGVGDNVLPLEVVGADGAATDREIRVFLSHRATADLAGLAGESPHYAVRFELADGAALTVAGRPVELDRDRSYVHTVALAGVLSGALDAGEALVHRVPFAVRLPDGQSVGGSVDTSIPRTRLRLDRPAPGTVTDRAAVTVAGATEPGATVTVGGVAAAVAEGRFTGSAPLAGEGVLAVEVTASSPGKAPRTERLVLRRVADLTPFVEEYSAGVDRSLDYRSLASNVEAARGRRVRFRGRVVALELARGQTLMQILLTQGCPSAEPCFLYAAHDGETDATVRGTVTVLGEVAGSRVLPTQGGGRLEMPAVEARFVVVDERGER